MRMLRVVLLISLVFPTMALAGTVTFDNTGGTLTGSNNELSMTGSEITTISGFGGLGIVSGSLGRVSFTTGALESGGSLQFGGAFSSGGTIKIVGNGSDGIPTGTIFNGTFTTATWTLTTDSNGNHNYAFVGDVTGTWYTGATVSGQITVNVVIPKGAYFNGKAPVAGGNTAIVAPVPEPGALGLVGTGLVSLAGLVRRKKKA